MEGVSEPFPTRHFPTRPFPFQNKAQAVGKSYAQMNNLTEHCTVEMKRKWTQYFEHLVLNLWTISLMNI